MGLLVFMSEEAVIETKKENLNVISEAEQESAIIAEAPAEEIKKIIGETTEETNEEITSIPETAQLIEIKPIEAIAEPLVEKPAEVLPAIEEKPMAEEIESGTAHQIVEEIKSIEEKPITRGMTFDNISDFEAQKARILIVGVGGAGNNTITALTEKGIIGASTVAINTDGKHLQVTKADKKIMIGKNLTRGLGAGGYPETGANAALESKAELKSLLKDIDLIFLTAGMGGGTGTGASPVIAGIAKEMGAIVISTITLPFKLEGARIHKAEQGLVKLREKCDTVIVIENQRLLDFAGNAPLKKAFSIADDLIATMIKGITETISVPSLVNLDYADVKAIMRSGGVASIGVGDSDSPSRARDAIQKALNHPLLDVDYNGATGALIQVIGGNDMKLEEINLIGEAVCEHLDPQAQIKLGARILPEYEHRLQVITIITGVKSPYIFGPMGKGAAPKSKVSKDFGIDVI